MKQLTLAMVGFERYARTRRRAGVSGGDERVVPCQHGVLRSASIRAAVARVVLGMASWGREARTTTGRVRLNEGKLPGFRATTQGNPCFPATDAVRGQTLLPRRSEGRPKSCHKPGDPRNVGSMRRTVKSNEAPLVKSAPGEFVVSFCPLAEERRVQPKPSTSAILNMPRPSLSFFCHEVGRSASLRKLKS
jgi:hypothetical protein